jgi:hypothetical protein
VTGAQSNIDASILLNGVLLSQAVAHVLWSRLTTCQLPPSHQTVGQAEVLGRKPELFRPRACDVNLSARLVTSKSQQYVHITRSTT